MTSYASFSYRTSAGLHAAAMAAGLALSQWSSPVHVHIVRGEAVWEASFAAPQATTQELPPVLISPSETSDEPAEPQPTEIEPTVVEVRRAAVPTELLLAQADLPKLPSELEACDCPAHEQSAQTPKRETPTTTPTPPEQPPAPPTPKRAAAKPEFTVTTAVSLPASAAVAGVDFDEPPRKIATNRPPPYPADAYQQRLQGRVVLEVHVNAEGSVDSLSVLQTSGVASFDQAALDAVRFWRFEPARRAGQSVAAVINVPVRFEMRSR
jgi:protein TonB